MGADRNDDSTGKGRSYDARSRSGILMVALITGACLGVICSERLYLSFHQPDRLSMRSGDKAVGGRRKLGRVTSAPSDQYTSV